MAIWQFQLNAIPKSEVIRIYHSLPEKLYINFEEWEKYLDEYVNTKRDLEPNFEDAKTRSWWKNSEIKANQVAKEIDIFLSRSNWGNSEDSFNWKGNSKNNEDHDAWISFNKENKLIEEFHFRIDLRDKDLSILRKFLLICKNNELLVFDNKGNLSEPEIDQLKKLISISRNLKFLTNPREVLEELAEENKNKSKGININTVEIKDDKKTNLKVGKWWKFWE